MGQSSISSEKIQVFKHPRVSVTVYVERDVETGSNGKPGQVLQQVFISRTDCNTFELGVSIDEEGETPSGVSIGITRDELQAIIRALSSV